MTAYRVVTPGPGFTVEAPYVELVADWAEQYLPCPAGAHRERRELPGGGLTTLVRQRARVLTGATITLEDRPRRGPRIQLEQCPVLLGNEDEGGQHQCARLAGHQLPHDARKVRT